MTETVTSLAQLGPALGSVAVIGILCWKLLQMFDNHSRALIIIQTNMQSHTEAMKKMSENVETNTRMTEKVIYLLADKKK